MSILKAVPITSLAVAILVGCGYSTDATYDDPEYPGQDTATVAGHYVATTFLVVQSGERRHDALAEGAGLTVTIAADGSVTGALTAPLSISGDPDLTADMAGHLVLEGEQVRFAQDAETFVARVPWTVGDRTLSVTDVTVGTSRFTVVLTRP